MKTKRILWLTQAYPSEADPVGGIFHRTQAEALASLGAKLQIVAPAPTAPAFLSSLSNRWKAYRKLPYKSETGGVEVFRPRYLALPKQTMWAAPHYGIRQAAQALKLEKPDLIHAHFAYPQGMAAMQLSRSWNVPFVVTLHGGDVNEYPEYNGLSRKRFCRVIGEAAEVMAVSGALIDRTKVLTGREARWTPIGIDLKRFSRLPDRQDARRELGLPKDRFLILYAGMLIPAKGIRELLAALRQFDPADVNGVFVGGGPLGEEVRSCPGTISAGVQPNERVPLYMAAADVLVLPSYLEGLPTVLVEAGAAGLPIVASTVGGIPALLDQGRGRLIPPHSAEELVRALSEIRSMESADRGQMTGRLSEHVAKFYDADKNAEALLDLYEEVLAGRPPAAQERPRKEVKG